MAGASSRRDSGIAVGGDGVPLGAAVDVADDQGRQQLPMLHLDPQGVGHTLRVEERTRAEELRGGRRLAAVLDQLGPGGGGAHPRMSAAAARNSSGSTAQISR